MPFKRSFRKPRRRFRKMHPTRRRVGRALARVPRTLGFRLFNTPSIRKISHKMVSRFTMDPSVTPLLSQTWRANDINNPHDGNPGDRPMGYDQLAALYQNWYVDSATVTVEVVSAAGVADSSVPGVVLLVSNADPSPDLAGGILALMSQGRTKYKLLQQSVNGNTFRLTEHFDPRKTFGVKDPADNDEQIGNTIVPGSPEVLAYFHVVYGALDDGAFLGPVWGTITIIYNVVWNTVREIEFSAGP